MSVIFSKEAGCLFCHFGTNRFTPTIEDINAAEEILVKNCKAANTPTYNQGDNCPIIHENLKHYRRQYYGYIDKENNKVIYVNFLWAKYTIFDKMRGYHKDESDTWKKEKVDVLDGCSHYWSIDINLTQQKLQNMYVNGSA